MEKDAAYNYDKMWKVNQKFLDNGINHNEIFYLANDPTQDYLFSNGTKRFYQREIDYLLEHNYTFEQMDNGLWIAIQH